jgi:hypothetical protein
MFGKEEKSLHKNKTKQNETNKTYVNLSKSATFRIND